MRFFFIHSTWFSVLIYIMWKQNLILCLMQCLNIYRWKWSLHHLNLKGKGIWLFGSKGQNSVWSCPGQWVGQGSIVQTLWVQGLGWKVTPELQVCGAYVSLLELHVEQPNLTLNSRCQFTQHMCVCCYPVYVHGSVFHFSILAYFLHAGI